MQRFTFHDANPPKQNFRDAVIEGLSRHNKTIPPKFFYDAQGSRLFDSICQQPEYYPPRVECQLLGKIASELVSLIGPGWVVIEPGVGSATKVRLIMEALRPAAFVPMDISVDYLRGVASKLAQDYAWMSVHAVHADFCHALPIPKVVPSGRRLCFFPGSTLGNFEPHEAEQFLRHVRGKVGDDGLLLIGVDTKKDSALLNAAYNDAAGVTAQFNINLLHRMQRELGAVVDTEGFAHHAFYNAKRGRVEMHLVSKRPQQLHINGHSFLLTRGESLHTENSYKYAPDEFHKLAAISGFKLVSQWMGDEDMFAIYLLAAN